MKSATLAQVIPLASIERPQNLQKKPKILYKLTSCQTSKAYLLKPTYQQQQDQATAKLKKKKSHAQNNYNIYAFPLFPKS